MSRYDTALRYFKENKDFMESFVPSQIERNRKGNIKITVKDKDGNVKKGVKVSIKLKNHEFRYGANIFMLDELESAEKNKLYREKFSQIFNLATIPFYWDDFEPEEGKPRFAADSKKIYRRPPSDLCVNYCLEKGIEPKCHCLNYDAFIPKWLEDADVNTHKKYLDKRFRELAEHYADIIPSWEVTNETFHNFRNKTTKFSMENDFVEWSFRLADKYFPLNKLIINDYTLFEDEFRGNRSRYFMQIERLLRNGIVHLDSIGMQYHSFFSKDEEEKKAKTRYNPIYLYEVLDKYSEFGKKIQITEMTIPAYSDSSEDEEVQGELIRNIYNVFFSHPSMEAAIYWNMVDGYAAWAPIGDMTKGENIFYGGVLRFDLSEKPSAKIIKDLFQKEWHTETMGETDSDGIVCLRGFYGDYEIKLISEDGEIEENISILSTRNNKCEIII